MKNGQAAVNIVVHQVVYNSFRIRLFYLGHLRFNISITLSAVYHIDNVLLASPCTLEDYDFFGGDLWKTQAHDAEE